MAKSGRYTGSRKLTPAGQRKGDVTFKLGEATKYSQPLKKTTSSTTRKASSAVSKPRVKTLSSPVPSVKKTSSASVEPKASRISEALNAPRIKDNTTSVRRSAMGSPKTSRSSSGLDNTGPDFSPLRLKIRQTGTKTSVAIQENYNTKDRNR